MFAERITPIITDCSNHLWNRDRYLDNGKKQIIWCAVFKKGHKATPVNYKMNVSPTSVACKTFEHIEHSHIMGHFEEYGILMDI